MAEYFYQKMLKTEGNTKNIMNKMLVLLSIEIPKEKWNNIWSRIDSMQMAYGKDLQHFDLVVLPLHHPKLWLFNVGIGWLELYLIVTEIFVLLDINILDKFLLC